VKRSNGSPKGRYVVRFFERLRPWLELIDIALAYKERILIVFLFLTVLSYLLI